MDRKNVEIKKVPFLGAELMAARDADGQIWAGVRWMCDGIGLSDGQRKRQMNNIVTDTVLAKGGSNLVLPTNGGPQNTMCLKLDFVPLWLAKISITPTMARETPDLAERLMEYQLRAKDVLAEAFLGKANVLTMPKTYSAALRALADEVELNEALEQKVAIQNQQITGMNAMAERNAPKVAFADAVMESKDDITVGDFAKLVFDETGMKFGRNSMFQLLRDMGYLMGNNRPYQKYMKAGYFTTAEVPKNGRFFVTTFITGKGQAYLFEKISNVDKQEDR